MNIYIRANGAETGPWPLEHIIAQYSQLAADALYRVDGSDVWKPIADLRIQTDASNSSYLPPAMQAPISDSQAAATTQPTALDGGTAGVISLLLPFFAMLLIILMPTPILSGLLLFLVIVTTAILNAREAKALGMGSPTDLTDKGKRREGPTTWFIAHLLIWGIAFPLYMARRGKHGKTGFGWIGLLFAILFWATSQGMLP